MMSTTIKETLILVSGGLVTGCAIAVGYFVVTNAPPERFVSDWETLNQTAVAADIEAVKEVPAEFSDVAAHFESLAIEKGGVHAFAVLIGSELPPNIDTHLVGHEIGDELYKQQGLRGMRNCTHELRNACSHSIVIGGLLEHGLGVFEQIHDICRQAPGGGPAYDMCFHGFGHGVLAYTEYKMDEAVELCSRVGTSGRDYYEFDECVGGAVMEMNGGIHDPIVWARNSAEFLDPDNPLALCQHDFMVSDVKKICYIYITPFIFNQIANNDLPGTDEFAQGMRYCDTLTDEEYREGCFGGFGKEFVTLVEGRDVRLVTGMSDTDMKQVVDWCMVTSAEDGREYCMEFVLGSLYWGGTNHYSLPLRACGFLSDQTAAEEHCYSHMIQLVHAVGGQSQDDYQAFCTAVPSNLGSHCRDTLLHEDQQS